MRKDETVTISLAHSNRLTIGLWLMHAVVLLAIVSYSALLYAKLAALVILCIGAWRTKAFLKQQNRITKLLLSEAMNFIWIDGVKTGCHVSGSPFVSPYVVIVPLHLLLPNPLDKNRIHVVFLAGAAHADELRKLRVFLTNHALTPA